MSQIPIVMGFAVPDRPREVRMEAAYFLQQLCQSRCCFLLFVYLKYIGWIEIMKATENTFYNILQKTNDEE